MTVVSRTWADPKILSPTNEPTKIEILACFLCYKSLYCVILKINTSFKNTKSLLISTLYSQNKRRGFKRLLIKSTIIQRTYRYENYNDFKMQYFTQSCLMKHFV